MALNISDLNQWRERRQGSVTLGVDATTPITVSQEQLESGTYILGVQGVGKSSLLESIILQQIAQNESVIAIDPHGDMVREIIARMPANRVQDAYIFDLKEARDWPFGMNLFALPRGQENSRPARDATRNQVIHAFERLWPEVKSGLYFGNVLRPIIATLIEKPVLTLAHVPRLFYNDTFRSQYTTGIQNFEAAQFWEEYEHWSPSKRERYCDPLLDRIRKLLSDDVVRTILCQKSAKLDIGKAISERKIFLLSLPLRDPAYEFAAPIIGTVFMTLLHGAIFSTGNLSHAKRPSCTVVIDEFQNFVTEDNEQFFSEGRKYRVKEILAHQGTHQLDRGDTTMKKTATSAYTIVCFRTNKDDAGDMAPLFSGIKRRPTNIHTQVVGELEGHPAIAVKRFYLDYIAPLQVAAKLRPTKEVPIPSYDFGYGSIACLPEDAQRVLHEINTFLFDAQVNQSFSENRLAQIALSYCKVVGLIRLEMQEDAQIRQDIDAYKRRMKELAEETFQREQVYKIQNAKRTDLYAEPDLKTYMQFSLNDFYKATAPLEERIRTLEKSLMKQVELHPNPAKERAVATQLQAVAQLLIAEPLAADKADISLAEIAEQLKGLPNYTALVKVESNVYQMATRDLQQIHPAIYYKDAIQRRNHIIKQTKDKYCRGRATVEKEIAQVYQIEPDKQEEKKKELRSDKTYPVSDKLRSQRKQPSRPTVTVIHPDTGKEVEVLEELFRVVEKVLEKPKERDKTLKQLIERSNRYLAQPGKQPNFYLTLHPLTGEELELDDYEYQQFYQHAQKEGWLQKKSVQDWVQDMDNFFHITREEQTHERHSPPLQGERVSTSQRTAPAHTPEKRRQEPQRRNTSRRRAISDSQWEPPSVFSDEEDDVIQ